MILLGGVSSVLNAETILTFGFKDGAVPPAFGNSTPAGGFALEDVPSPNKLGRPGGNGSAFGIRAGSFACQPGFSGLPRGASGGGAFGIFAGSFAYHPGFSGLPSARGRALEQFGAALQCASRSSHFWV
jgi:hypothetical protein